MLKYLQCRKAFPLAIALSRADVKPVSEGQVNEPKSWAYVKKEWIIIEDPSLTAPAAVELMKNKDTGEWEEHLIPIPDFMQHQLRQLALPL